MLKYDEIFIGRKYKVIPKNSCNSAWSEVWNNCLLKCINKSGTYSKIDFEVLTNPNNSQHVDAWKSKLPTGPDSQGKWPLTSFRSEPLTFRQALRILDEI